MPQNIERASTRRRLAIWIGAYNLILFLAFVFGALTQVSSEGFGFLPLFAFTLPWSWPVMFIFGHASIWNLRIWGTGLSGTLVIHFVALNLLCGTANSWVLYQVLRWREKRRAEIRDWEDARWHR